MNEPYKECPQFDTCSVNNCPLHPNYPNLSVCKSGDTEIICKAHRATREEIAAKYPGILKFNGRTKREVKRDDIKKRWDDLPEKEKQRRKNEMMARIGKFKFTKSLSISPRTNPKKDTMDMDTGDGV
jgi:hypothetical protein